MKPPFTVTLNLNNESGVCAGATSWPFGPSVEVTDHSLSFHLTDVTRLTDTDQRTAGSGGLYLRSSLQNSRLVNGQLYILMCNRQSSHQTADRLAFIGGGYFFLMVERTHNKDKWFLHLPLSPSSLPTCLRSLTHRTPVPLLLHLSCLLIYLSSHHTHLSSFLSDTLGACHRAWRVANTSNAPAEHVQHRIMGNLVNDTRTFPKSRSNTFTNEKLVWSCSK